LKGPRGASHGYRDQRRAGRSLALLAEELRRSRQKEAARGRWHCRQVASSGDDMRNAIQVGSPALAGRL